MVFASSIFLFVFFPLVLGVYFLIGERFKNLWLFLASLFFYAWGGLSYALLILFSTLVNFLIGLWMDGANGGKRKFLLVIGVVYNLGILGFFKYFNFFVDNIQTVIRLGNPEFDFFAPRIALPIGISFFTFQIMSYVIDLYRREIGVQKNFVNLGLYIMLFPQLIAGPIVRYIDVEKQINHRVVTLDSFTIGLRRFIVGLGKKVLIANAMGSWADQAFNNMGSLSTPMAWVGIVGYTLQIYFDFSAYSDMAIGIGKMFGFDFLENFNYPYIAPSIQEFWRRWHMSLTTWFRDYLYIPLGGNRKGKIRTYINNFIVFFCTGFWHGAAWNFLFWGLFHGAFQILEKSKAGTWIRKMPRPMGHLYTMFVVMMGWVLFRAANLKDALEYGRTLFVWNEGNLYLFFRALDNTKLVALALAIIFSTPIGKIIGEKVDDKGGKWMYLKYSGITILFLVSVMFVSGSTFNPFIYFRF